MGEEALDRRVELFGALLRRYRHAANLTQEQLAARSGLSVQAISMLERGVRRAPRTSTVECLAGAMRLAPPDQEALAAAARERMTRGAPSAPVELCPARPPEPRAGIPPDPVVRFAGREAELAELHHRLQRRGRVAVHGLGGIGKTQLVVQYLHQRRAGYPDGVFWLRADHESALVGDLASLAWRLRLPERELPEQERQVEAVLRWLCDHPRWLLVLDNLEPEAQEAVSRWLPPGLPGHLLVTSRMPVWAAGLGLEPLPLEIAARFLLQRTRQVDRGAAGEVAEALGCLPLALAQAAGYLEVTGRDLASYAGLLRTRLLELMAEGRPEDYPAPVATMWQLSFERLESERPAAACLLRLCAFLAPDDIPVGVLQAGAGELPEELRDALTDDLELDRTIAALRRYSLMDRQGDGLRVHRLVQAVVRESLTCERREAWLAAAIRLLRAGCRFPDEPELRPELWPLCARLMAHVETAERLAAGRPVEPRALGWLLYRAGHYLWARGELAQAWPLHQHALAIRERALGPDDPETAESADGVAYVLREQGDLDAARSLHERALAIRERALGPDHPSTANSLNDLAGLLREQGEMDRSRSLHERALAIRERVLGPDHLSTANSLNNLGFLLWERGEMDAARSLYERSLAIRERALGPDHPYTATSLNNLALLLRDQGRLADARLLFERALAIRERVLGPDHPRTARCLHNLAVLLRSQGEVAPARLRMERALASLQRALGPGHRLTIESRRALEEMAAQTGPRG